MGSTTSRTPSRSMTVSSSASSSSKVKPYWKPEHPPPVTNTRRLRRSLPSSSISERTLATALSLNCMAAGVKTSTLDITTSGGGAAAHQAGNYPFIRLFWSTTLETCPLASPSCACASALQSGSGAHIGPFHRLLEQQLALVFDLQLHGFRLETQGQHQLDTLSVRHHLEIAEIQGQILDATAGQLRQPILCPAVALLAEYRQAQPCFHSITLIAHPADHHLAAKNTRHIGALQLESLNPHTGGRSTGRQRALILRQILLQTEQLLLKISNHFLPISNGLPGHQQIHLKLPMAQASILELGLHCGTLVKQPLVVSHYRRVHRSKPAQPDRKGERDRQQPAFAISPRPRCAGVQFCGFLPVSGHQRMSPGCSSPMRSSSPRAMFMFWMA